MRVVGAPTMRHAVLLFGADRNAWCFDDQLERLKKRISRAVENPGLSTERHLPVALVRADRRGRRSTHVGTFLGVLALTDTT
jgi:hypothetical protein